MTFQPVLPFTGLTGWSFLKRTMERQQGLQQATPALQRDEAYFRARIGQVRTAEEFVSDRRLLRVGLAAFGLEGDLNNRAFIRQVLDGGTLKEGSLANRLADKRYQMFSAAFGFGDFSVPRTRLSTFPDEILTRFRTRNFETAVGLQNNAFRLALNAERELAELALRPISETARWYTVLGSPPLREVLQAAFNLPRSFAAIDLDQQVASLRDKTERAFGSSTISQFADPAKLEALIRRFHVNTSALDQPATNSPAAIALAILRR